MVRIAPFNDAPAKCAPPFSGPQKQRRYLPDYAQFVRAPPAPSPLNAQIAAAVSSANMAA